MIHGKCWEPIASINVIFFFFGAKIIRFRFHCYKYHYTTTNYIGKSIKRIIIQHHSPFLLRFSYMSWMDEIDIYNNRNYCVNNIDVWTWTKIICLSRESSYLLWVCFRVNSRFCTESLLRIVNLSCCYDSCCVVLNYTFLCNFVFVCCDLRWWIWYVHTNPEGYILFVEKLVCMHRESRIEASLQSEKVDTK